MKTILFLSILTIFVLSSCKTNIEQKIEVKNESRISRVDHFVSIELDSLQIENVKSIGAFCNDEELPSQLLDSDGDGIDDQFGFLINLDANQEKNVKVKVVKTKKEFPKRVHAEVSEKRDYEFIDGVYTGGHFESVKTTTPPSGHRDHNFYYKCEGPVWESDRVGYRLYLDARNSTDIFGKKVTDIVLSGVGHDKDAEGHDRYHSMADWGMDLLKVGNSLGLGTFGIWINDRVEKIVISDSTTCTITNDGVIQAALSIKYFGWEIANEKTDITSKITINAGSRLTYYSFDINSKHSEFCTGFAKHKNTKFAKSENSGENQWNYISQWGNQSLVSESDELGIALFYNNEQLIALTEDEHSNIVLLNPLSNKIDYYFAACWTQEPSGIKTEKEFKVYLNKVVDELNSPVMVSISK